MVRLLKVIFFIALPGAFLIWLLYRAIWTISSLYLAKHTFSTFHLNQNNIKVCTQWMTVGSEWQIEHGQWVNGKPVHPVEDFFSGWTLFWILPYILVSPGFYSGLFWGKNDPQNFILT